MESHTEEHWYEWVVHSICCLVLKEIRKRSERVLGIKLLLNWKEDFEPREVEVPADLQSALEAVPISQASFDRLSYTHQKEYVRWIMEAKMTRPARSGSNKRSRCFGKGKMDTKPLQPIGIFNSGIGGLTVLRAIHQLMPDEPLIYLADQAHVPYGPRPMQEVRQFSEAITRYLLDQGSSLIVVACNICFCSCS